jgi:hypothetical protein
MKILRFPLFAALLGGTAFAQTNTLPASGNVGIGTTTPDATLTVNTGAYLLRTATATTDIELNGFTGGGGWARAFRVGKDGATTHRYGAFGSVGNEDGLAYTYLAAPSGSEDGTGYSAAAKIVLLPNGNVGIGTPSPSRKLTVQGDALFGDGERGSLIAHDGYSGGRAFLVLDKNSQNGTGNGGDYLYLGQESTQAALFSAAGTSLSLGTGATPSVSIAPSGNVGIGGINASTAQLLVASPQSNAANTVVAEFSKEGGSNSYGSAMVRLSRSVGGESTDVELNSGGSGPFRFGTYADTLLVNNQNATNGPYGSIQFITNGSERMTIGGGTLAGNVGIGTTNPTHKLAVNGTIKAKEVIVETTGWSDYVFDDDYALQPLAEVEAHIKTNKHLPGIPSAVEIAEQGVSVGDMQARLLAKIEELTLHVIAQEKLLKAQASQLTAQADELKAQLAAQADELSALRAVVAGPRK